MSNPKIFENTKKQSTKNLIKPTTNLQQQKHLLKKVSLLLLLPLMFLQIINCFTFCLAENNNKVEEMRRWSNGVGLWGKRSMSSGTNELLDNPTENAFLFKRPENSWHKLNALWGKRSSVGIPPSSNWQTATGLWGKKRSVISPLPSAWQQISAYYDLANSRR
ncbi:unnamed protein product [Meloidogyne enterolobii]|uniref:Uncharacterized protein n=1 Tax=Meloidogyne enterolobii TaxID=390850 RepID=A0ACB1A4U9_MELEN